MAKCVLPINGFFSPFSLKDLNELMIVVFRRLSILLLLESDLEMEVAEQEVLNWIGKNAK